jgi:hypothetical protein
MHRRRVLQALAAAFAVGPNAALRAQAPPSASTFGAAQIATLGAIAEVVLPSSVDSAGRRDVVAAFVRWFAGYRDGADMGHGYGSSTLRQASGPSPIARYAAQFAALDAEAVKRGASTFAALPIPARREIVEAALNVPQPVNRLPSQPAGGHLIADLMGFYFNSAEAWNLAYRAEINRDSCRTLEDSAREPRALKVK